MAQVALNWPCKREGDVGGHGPHFHDEVRIVSGPCKPPSLGDVSLCPPVEGKEMSGLVLLGAIVAVVAVLCLLLLHRERRAVRHLSALRPVLPAATRDDGGQAVVEFALLITVLFFIFLGVVDFARFMYDETALQNSVRQGVEMAMNHCPNPGNCGLSSTPTSSSIVLWATSCESQGVLNLQPSFTSCSPGTGPAWTPTCAGACSNCVADICDAVSGNTVTVSAGYTFTPFTPFISTFFPVQSCFSGDASANGHTLCARVTGVVK